MSSHSTPLERAILIQELVRWEYQYAARPQPVILAATDEPESPGYISSTALPIKCTKEDLELKEVYIEPSFADEPPIYMICDGKILPPTSEQPSKKEGDGKVENEKKEEKKVRDPISSRAQRSGERHSS